MCFLNGPSLLVDKQLRRIQLIQILLPLQCICNAPNYFRDHHNHQEHLFNKLIDIRRFTWLSRCFHFAKRYLSTEFWPAIGLFRSLHFPFLNDARRHVYCNVIRCTLLCYEEWKLSWCSNKSRRLDKSTQVRSTRSNYWKKTKENIVTSPLFHLRPRPSKPKNVVPGRWKANNDLRDGKRSNRNKTYVPRTIWGPRVW